MAARNFLMLSVDDMRTIGNWGRFTPLIETPNIDRLAEMGTTFERAVTQVPLCNPARTSVLSGQQPSRTGVLDNAMVWHERVNPADTLPGVLKAAGAYVAMFGKLFHDETTLTPAQQSLMAPHWLSTWDGNRHVGSSCGEKRTRPLLPTGGAEFASPQP